MRLQQILEKYLPLVGNMLIPVTIFAIGLLSYLADDGFSFDTAVVLHRCFYSLSLIALLILLNFNCGRPLFLITTITITYVLINYLKNRYASEAFSTVWFYNLEVLAPWNMLLFYLCSNHRFISRRSLLMIVVLIGEYTLAEILGRYNINMGVSSLKFNLLSNLGFALLLIWSLIKAVKNGLFYDYAVFFVALSIRLGLGFADNASGLALFFFVAQFILVVWLTYTFIHSHYYDELTGFYSRNSYLLQSKRFPLKYSLGIVSIDNYDKLLNLLGISKLNIITALLANVLEEQTPEDAIYRYAPDQFIILYKKLDKKEAFVELEKVRRTIAGLSFTPSTRQKPFKLTVSCSVSEKKRSDASAVEVLMRADKAMRKTLKFSHNVTSQG